MLHGHSQCVLCRGVRSQARCVRRLAWRRVSTYAQLWQMRLHVLDSTGVESRLVDCVVADHSQTGAVVVAGAGCEYLRLGTDG